MSAGGSPEDLRLEDPTTSDHSDITLSRCLRRNNGASSNANSVATAQTFATIVNALNATDITNPLLRDIGPHCALVTAGSRISSIA